MYKAFNLEMGNSYLNQIGVKIVIGRISLLIVRYQHTCLYVVLYRNAVNGCFTKLNILTCTIFLIKDLL